MKGKRYYTSDNDGHLFTFFRLFIPTTLTKTATYRMLMTDKIEKISIHGIINVNQLVLQ